MLTQVFEVMSLRGMDQRWKPESARARLVMNMRWDPRDGWTRSGGDRSMAQPTSAAETIQPTDAVSVAGGVVADAVGESDVGDDPFKEDGQEIHSLHWFAQHNGARQWTIWETAGGQLRAFWGAGISLEGSAGGGSRDGKPWKDLTMARSFGRSPQKWDGSDRTRTILDTPSIRTQSVSWGGRLYMVNGYDEPIVFDGSKCTRAGYAGAPSAPVGSVVAYESIASLGSDGDYRFNYWTKDLAYGMGIIGEAGSSAEIEKATSPLGRGDKWNMWRYRVSFINERGQESPLSPESNSVRAKVFWEPNIDRYGTRRNNEVGRRFVAVDIPCGPPGTVARRLYRTQDMLDHRGQPANLAEGSNYYFAHEIQDNVTKSFEDMLPDTALGGVVDEEDFGPWPTSARLLASFKNTMFVAGATDNLLRFSRALNPEVFPRNNVIEIGNAEAGPITGMYATKNALIVFKRKAIYLVKRVRLDGLHDFEAQTLTRDVGCCAANTIAEIPGKGLAFLSESGVMLLRGALENTGTPTEPVHLSQPIPDLIKEINFSAAENACGLYHHKEKEYWLSVPTLSSAENNRVLVFHTEILEWSVRSGFNIGCMVDTRDHRGHLMYGTNSRETLNPGIRVYSLGQNAILGDSAVASEYSTVDHDFGSKFKHFIPAYINVYTVGYGDSKLELNFRVNRSETFSLEVDREAQQQELLEPLATFDSAVWGTDDWGYHRPICIRYDVSAMHEGVVRELSVTFKAQDSIQLVGYDIEGKLGAQRAIRPLSDALSTNRR